MKLNLAQEIEYIVYVGPSSKHEDPKSITLMADLDGCLSRMFSGFKSQWITRCDFRNFKPMSSWEANRLIRLRLRPWKLLLLMSKKRHLLAKLFSLTVKILMISVERFRNESEFW